MSSYPTTLAEPRTRRFSRAEYYRMADLGLFRDQRVELLNGEVVEIPAQRDTHVIAVSLATKAAAAAFGPGFWVRVQAPINLGKFDDPEPDVCVVAGSERDYVGSGNRVDPLLVIEISDTTLPYDRGRKARRYARAGIADYWIVNLTDRRLEVRREPKRLGNRYAYGSVRPLAPDEVITPLAAPGATVHVADLLP